MLIEHPLKCAIREVSEMLSPSFMPLHSYHQHIPYNNAFNASAAQHQITNLNNPSMMGPSSR